MDEYDEYADESEFISQLASSFSLDDMTRMGNIMVHAMHKELGAPSVIVEGLPNTTRNIIARSDELTSDEVVEMLSTILASGVTSRAQKQRRFTSFMEEFEYMANKLDRDE